MIRPIQPHNPFTPDAEKRWKAIPKWAQRKILCNVFCGFNRWATRLGETVLPAFVDDIVIYLITK